MRRPFDDLVFRAALGRFATGVIVLSTGPRPRPHAMTANAFLADPPQPGL
jgi:flavin reductase